ncbi:MAG TPA: hypothetical protein VFK41_01580 [Nocardioidaceae bacterium]|nr:hypothetical protein [Nocardioidaceae bacterium]
MKRVLVHVGAPKTGTTFIQDLLFQHRESLAEQGILYPAHRFDAHFLAALDLMELPWGGLEQQAVGAWDDLAERVRAFDGTSIVSHEILARASRDQVKRALDSFGDAEVHVVLSARDLVRQIPAEWQENVKHRRVLDYGAFLDRIMNPARTGELASWFWGVQDVPDILDRWGSTLPPEHVHLVTVPPSGAPRGLLWERFASVFGLDPTAYVTESERANPSLGALETDYLRRVNQRVNGGVLANEHYREFVRELLAHRTLSQRSDSPRLSLPQRARTWATELSQEWVKELGDRGYDVVGSLDELVPQPAPDDFVDPDLPAHDDDVALDATVALLREAARLRSDNDRLWREKEAAVRALDEAAGPVLRLKRRVVRASETRPTVRRALGVYRRLRGR